MRVQASTVSEISHAKELLNAKYVNYWLAPNCEYSVSIPAAAQLLTYPEGMSNKLNLYPSNNKDDSCIEFYQVYLGSTGTVAETRVYAKLNGTSYQALTVAQKSTYDWVYGTIDLNEDIMGNYNSTTNAGVILHEMLHVYGLKDQYYDPNCIMYGYLAGKNANTLTITANQVLNFKYPE